MLNYIRRQWIARPLAVFSACFLLGVLYGSKQSLPLYATCIILLIVLGAHSVLKKRARIRWYILPPIVAFLLGNARMLAEYQLYPTVPELFSVEYSGTVVSAPYLNESTERIICILRIDELCGKPANYDVKLYLRSSELELTGIEYGQRLECLGHVWPQESATNPYEYDGMNALRADGLEGMAAAKLEDVRITPAQPSLGSLRVRFQQAISDRIDILFPNNADLVRAFVIGDRSGLDHETNEAFRKTGITHLICISGLHISTLAAAISKLLSLRLSRRASALGTLTGILVYGILIGFPSSLVRATVMFALYSFVPIVGRPSDPATRLCTALLGMLIVKPFNIFDGGFVLSFSASAGILLLTEPLEHLFCIAPLRKMKLHPKRLYRVGQRLIRYFPQLLCTTLAAQLTTLPVVIGYFGFQPLISIPVNLLAIPLAMGAYPISLLALLVSTIWMPLGQAVAFVSDSMFSMLVELVHFFAHIPAYNLRAPTYPAWLIALHWNLVLLASGMNRISIKVRRFLPLTLAMLVCVSMMNAWINTLGFTAIFLDAGQADASVIKSEGHVILCDTGDLYSPAVDYVSSSCMSIDAVFLSHPHYDHAAGLRELVETMPPKTIYVPSGWNECELSDTVAAAMDAAQEAGIPIIELVPGATVRISKNTSAHVHEPIDSSRSLNDLSLLLEIRYRDKSLFYTGDLSSESEPVQSPDIDIFKVAHHGSAKASSERFLQQTTPEIAVISVGDNNYGHPSAETLDRLHKIGARVFRTDHCGAITVRINRKGNISVQTYLPMEASK